MEMLADGDTAVKPRAGVASATLGDPHRDRFIIGSPAECADQIQRSASAVGTSMMIFRVNWPGAAKAMPRGANSCSSGPASPP
jgi:alkanesulfonate monooxygenase SsuD/methylene tetrahydromethanopterin reductase-like flavin-dependent oxidoreductase (luciferase family)